MIYMQQKPKHFLPNSADTVSIELRWAIPSGFFGKIFPCSSILKDHLVTVDSGVIDSDFRGIVEALLVNHFKNTYTVRTGDKIAQVVLIEKFVYVSLCNFYHDDYD